MFERFKTYPMKSLRVCHLGITSRVGRFPAFCRPINHRNIVIAIEEDKGYMKVIKNNEIYLLFEEKDKYAYVPGKIVVYQMTNLSDTLLDNGYQLNGENLSYKEILKLEDDFNDVLEEETKKKEKTLEDNSEIHDPILRNLVNLGKLANELDDEEVREKIKKEIEQLGTFYVTELFKIKTNISEELILPNPLDSLKMDCIKKISKIETEIKQKKENNTLETDLQKLQRSLRS